MNLKKLANVNGRRCVNLLVICVFGSNNKPLRWTRQPNPFLKCKEKKQAWKSVQNLQK